MSLIKPARKTIQQVFYERLNGMTQKMKYGWMLDVGCFFLRALR